MTAQKEKDILEVLKKIIRIGTVHAYDASTRMARVKFDNLGGIISPPIKVLTRPRAVVPGEKEKTGNKTDKADGHFHAAYVTDWNPKINDQVLCLYYPDGDGYVWGEV